jgi:LacI family transcriptional regulator
MKKRNVLMALTSTHHGFFRGIAHYARDHNWHLHTFMAYSGRIPIGWKGDGVISFTGYRGDLAEFVRNIRGPKVELTLVQNDLDAPRVDGDNYRIGQMAAEYFLQRHFRHFAWAPFADDTPNMERFTGFQDTLEKQRYQVVTLPTAYIGKDIPVHIDWACSSRKLLQSLKNMPKPFALFAYNDSVGAEMINACYDADLLVPEQVAVMGVDNDEIVCESVSIPLSSIGYDLYGVAYEGAALLDRLMDGQPAPKETIRIAPKGLVTRRSTDILAMNNVEVAKAIRYIWSHFEEPSLTVERVREQTTLSLRGLFKAFHKEVHRSVHDEIVRVRMEKVADYLKNTSYTAAAITEETGFSSPNHLFRAFRRYYHTSPKEYRKKHCH